LIVPTAYYSHCFTDY